MLAVLPHNKSCTNIDQSAYLDENRYRAGYSRHHWKSPHRETLYANMCLRSSNWRFQNVELQKCGRLRPEAYHEEVESALESAQCVGQVEVHLFLSISNVSLDFLRCHLAEEGRRMFCVDEALPGVFVSQPSPFYAQETKHTAFSLLGPWREDC